MASYESSDDNPPTPSETPRLRNASELDVATRLTGHINDGQSQAVVGMAMVNKSSALLDFPTFDLPTFDLPKFDFSSAMNSIDIVYKTSALLDLPKFNYPTIDLPKFNFAKFDFSSAMNSIETQSLLVDPDFLEKLDELFNQLPEGELLLAGASDDLIQVVSFEYNETVRRFLQVLVVVVFHTILAGAYMIPFVAGPLSAYGTPNAKQTWKATGAAYDRLYRTKDYHPGKALEKGTPLITRSGPRRTTRR